jgi:hypothetical protein
MYFGPLAQAFSEGTESMSVRYQVFVSSTYLDLIDERQAVMHALLELGCIPSGMELFPAGADDVWRHITKVIDECDYYLLIVAGRYGSCDATGKSFTEKEYEYAVRSHKRVVPFLHKNPGSLPAEKVEDSPSRANSLARLRSKLKRRGCNYWETPQELALRVNTSLAQLVRDNPDGGWVRRDQEALLRRTMRDVTLSEAVAQIGLADIEFRDNSVRTLPPSQFYAVARREIVISAGTAFTTLKDNRENLINAPLVRALSERKRVFLVILHPLWAADDLQALGTQVKKDLASEVRNSISIIKDLRLLKYEGFQLRFLAKLPPYAAVMIDGDVEALDRDPYDKGGEIRVQPYPVRSTTHTGIVLQLRKIPGNSSGFDYFAQDVRRTWAEVAKPDPSLLDAV